MSNDYLTMLQGAAPAVPAEISAPKNEYMDMLQADADQRAGDLVHRARRGRRYR